MIREEVIWAAGLFEGEGCFTQTGQRRYPTAQMNLTDFDTLERFARAVGIGRLHSKGTRQKVHHKPAATWSVSGFEGVQFVYALFWPWLGERRRARGKQVLEECRLNQAESPHRGRWRRAVHHLGEVDFQRLPTFQHVGVAA